LNKSPEIITRNTTADKVFEILRGWILSGRFKPGDILPSQDDLALKLRVSRNTLREAIFKLSAMGLVKSKQGVGTVVQPTTPSNYIGSLPDQLLLDDITLQEFIEARIFTERTLIKLAVAKAGEAQLDKLADILKLQKQAMDQNDGPLFNDQDLNFHLELGRICNNLVMRKFYETIWDLLHRFTSFSFKVPGNIELAYEHHVLIYEAIRDRDADLAARHLVKHIREISERTIDYLKLEVNVKAIFDRIII
jgi:GntR family transcriptional repressor for pyruvate dehydrogenase complex